MCLPLRGDPVRSKLCQHGTAPSPDHQSVAAEFLQVCLRRPSPRGWGGCCAQHFFSRSSTGAAGLRTNNRTLGGGDNVDTLHLLLPVTCTNNKAPALGPSCCCAMRSGVCRHSQNTGFPPTTPGGRGGLVFASSGVRGQQREYVRQVVQERLSADAMLPCVPARQH